MGNGALSQRCRVLCVYKEIRISIIAESLCIMLLEYTRLRLIRFWIQKTERKKGP